MLASVTMNDGMPTYAIQNPCQAPRRAESGASATARDHGTSCSIIRIAASAPTNAASEPTDRSMCPAMITITMPIARTRM